jgi:hypothetical protein
VQVWQVGFVDGQSAALWQSSAANPNPPDDTQVERAPQPALPPEIDALPQQMSPFLQSSGPSQVTGAPVHAPALATQLDAPLERLMQQTSGELQVVVGTPQS